MANVKLTKTIVQNVIEAMKIDCTVEEACRHAGISKQTHYNWIKEKKFYFDEKPVIFKWKTILKKTKIFYEDAIKKAEDYIKMLARNTIVREIEKWNAKIAMEVLTKRDVRYRDKVDTTITEGIVVNEEDLIDD